MLNYAITSIETHLFFARIMREHALFLEAGFPCKDESWIQKADFFREQFEALLCEAVKIGGGRIHDCLIKSDELVTEFTIPAEKRTALLTGISIDSSISEAELGLHKSCGKMEGKELFQIAHRMNERSIQLLNGLIDFKESLLREMGNCSLYNANYPLLIQHIIREAKLYRATIQELMQNRRISYRKLCETEIFWNQIMMEHALFIRGLLDPSEEQLICTADEFAKDYKRLLEKARHQDCRAMNALTRESLSETLKYRDFKAAGASGILNCSIASIILPLLADHVLREANHYIRLLTMSRMD